jgi:F0F1-type ATP synthase gamma subunit
MRPEEIYDYMLEHKIGTNFTSTYDQISKYYELELLDFKKADKVYRVGLDLLKGDQKNHDNLRVFYNKFSARMANRIKEQITP